MAIVKEMPADIPTTNALANIPDDPNNVAREIRLGANVLLVLDDAPGMQETRDIVLRLRTWRRGEDQPTPDGETTYFCQTKIVTAWELGKPKPPNADENQPGLYDEAGEPNPDAEPDDEQDDEQP